MNNSELNKAIEKRFDEIIAMQDYTDNLQSYIESEDNEAIKFIRLAKQIAEYFSNIH